MLYHFSAARSAQTVDVLWHHPYITIVLVSTSAFLAIGWHYRVPSPGKAVSAMGVLAVITTLRGEMSGVEKTTWLLLTFLFLLIEIRAINQERRRAEETFSKIANGVETAICNGVAMMASAQAIIANITGGNSYSVVVPMSRGDRPDNAISLRIENHGENILSGVTVTLYNSGVWMGFTHSSIINSVNNRINVGTLAPCEKLVLSRAQINPEQFMHTQNEGESFIRVFVYIGAHNYTVHEYLDFKRDEKKQWLFRFKAYKYKLKDEILLEAVDWSDDANNLMPVSNPKWH